ncbi:Alpha/Beta hydrolase protein [Ilyonectria robusta]|uniref:Alpha/Beta hydrolase protein n=1 Tax=Ilyonectria robusta TaxID=1079257 RepID=UPI001E8EBD3B|nr:Alpha/Beta hydrolase protein [Ilyonectria robusta]KAH8683856.1 Alpha/Beta hydrolase protein [Ilyonectria robusta]
MSAVSVTKGSIKLASLVFKPFSLSTKAPGVVIIHPTGGVKEQTASELEGLPRYLENPAARVTGASAVADFLQQLYYVDANRIGIVRICRGGGYAIAAAKGDHRFKAVAVISAVSMGHGVRLRNDSNHDPAEKVAVLDQVSQALQAEAKGCEAVTVPIVPPVLDANATKEARDIDEFYLTPRPVLIVAGEKATTWHSEKLFKVLAGKNKDLKKVIMPNGGHIDFYDLEDYVNPAVAEMADFFKSRV